MGNCTAYVLKVNNVNKDSPAKKRSYLLIEVVHVFSVSTFTTPTTVIVKITNVRSASRIFYQLFHQSCSWCYRYTKACPFFSFHFGKIHFENVFKILGILLQTVVFFRWQLHLRGQRKTGKILFSGDHILIGEATSPKTQKPTIYLAYTKKSQLFLWHSCFFYLIIFVRRCYTFRKETFSL